MKKDKNIENKKVCGLCGKSKKLVKTGCCGNWICDDEDNYVLFSYSRNSCSRNHRRFTLCGLHHNEEHKGEWKGCKKCLDILRDQLEMYAWYGTNEYNFTKLENPPKFEPTYCYKCKRRIVLPEEGYSILCGVLCCEDCELTDEEREEIIKNRNKDKNK